MMTGSAVIAVGGSSTSLADVDELGRGGESISTRLSKKASAVAKPLYKGLVSTVGGLMVQKSVVVASEQHGDGNSSLVLVSRNSSTESYPGDFSMEQSVSF